MEAQKGETPQVARCEAQQRDRPLAGDANTVEVMQTLQTTFDKMMESTRAMQGKRMMGNC
jgi:hypothetical protein